MKWRGGTAGRVLWLPCLLSRLTAILALASVPGLGAARLHAQETSPPTTLTVRSNLVLVPALVKTRSGELVFSLTSNDFVLTDNGVAQPLRLEDDTDSQPLALAIVVETGGLGRSHLGDYSGLSGVLTGIIGAVPHHVAVVSFDSHPTLAQPFTPDTDLAAAAVGALQGGDDGAAILDALTYSIDLLRKEPPSYRRAIVLFSETIDSGSETTLDEALRAVDNTNTAIYTFAFSSAKGALRHEVSKVPRPGGTPYSDQAYAKGGCMSREPGADPDAHGRRSVQALDCAGDLFPPIRIAKIAFLAAEDGIKRNVPESVAQLTGGEYFSFKNAKTLRKQLVTIANDVPNHYVLSFRPQDPAPGLHALDLRLKDRPGLELKARSAYFVDAPAQP